MEVLMNGPIVLALSDKIALAGVAASLLAIIVAVWCVDLSLKSSLRVNTLIEIRDDLVRTLDKIEALLREIDDTNPLTSAVMQKVSIGYWESKHQFEASYQKATIILSQRQIAPWSEAMPQVIAAYDRFAEGYHKHCR
jgi:hypothetical protein